MTKLRALTITIAALIFAFGPAALVFPQIGPPGGSGGGTPCTTTALSVQFNNAGAFGCVPNLTWTAGSLRLRFTTSGTSGAEGFDVADSSGSPVITTRSAGNDNTYELRNASNVQKTLVGYDAYWGNSATVFKWDSSTGISGADTGFARNAAGVVEANNGTLGTLREAKFRSVILGGTVPGISGCSAGTQTGGATAGTYSSGTSGACTVVLTFAFAAPAGWSCATNNQTTAADPQRQSASTTTTATITGTTVSGDVINFHCFAY